MKDNVKIYLDMDGVLADFDGGVKKFCNIAAVDQSVRTRKQAGDFWSAVRKIKHFYDRLELLPGAETLFDLAYRKSGADCEILTGIPRPIGNLRTASVDKENWVHRLLDPDVRVNTVFRIEKLKFCQGKECILIDDLPATIDAWRRAGGTGILYRNADQACSELEDVLRNLKK